MGEPPERFREQKWTEDHLGSAPSSRERQQKILTDVGSVLVLIGIAFVLFGGGVLVPALILAALFAMKFGWDLASWRRRKRR